MLNLLGKYKNNYTDVFLEKESNYSKIYRATNISDDNDCCLKIIDKKVLEQGEYDFLLDQIKREEEILYLCKSENIVNLKRKLETEDSIIYELEYCETDLDNYLINK